MTENDKVELIKCSKSPEKLKYFLDNFPAPEIEDSMNEVAKQHIEKYHNIYIQTAIKCIEQEESTISSSGYFEKHHMVPKSMGGADEKINIVSIPVRYHVFLHLILGEAFPNNVVHNYALKLIFGWAEVKDKSKLDSNVSRATKERAEVIQKHYSTRFIAKIRADNCRVPKEKHPNFGKHLSLETRKRISESSHGKTIPEEVRKKMSLSRSGPKNPNFGKKFPEETLKKLSKAHKGKPNTEEQKKKISISTSGEHNHNFGKPMPEEVKKKLSEAKKGHGLGSSNPNARKVVSPEGKIYGSILDAVHDTGIPKGTLTKWLHKIHRPDSGWKFLEDKSE